jgi:hypothetical protein
MQPLLFFLLPLQTFVVFFSRPQLLLCCLFNFSALALFECELSCIHAVFFAPPLKTTRIEASAWPDFLFYLLCIVNLCLYVYIFDQ